MGPRMETCCRHVLLLVIVAAAATAVPSQHKTLSYEEAIALAVDFYNQGSGIDHAFRLLKADPQPEWDTHIRRSRSPRRSRRPRPWHLPGSYTLISHGGGKGKGKGSRLQVA
ncbi:deuterosome protein 1 [Platysternon megacephalum]|uniref:Deuterosome protein 1 n=1 Tax=Platysternon megacephalum TaxID=55544 RepID=A0A4D9ECY9_9SAUR|nr:deuterosome protein 1 [Platysternon megacephalum]